MQMETNTGNGSMLYSTQDITKESQHWDKNQNVSWDELGQL